MTKTYDGEDITVFLKRETMEQFPFLKAENLKHSEYAKKSIEDLFDTSKLKKAQQTKVNYMKSIIAINEGNGNFKIMELPKEAQFSCINAISIFDLDNNGYKDLILAGNFTKYIPQFTRLDACSGLVMLNHGQNKYTTLQSRESKFKTYGEVRDLKNLKIGPNNYFISFSNNQKPQSFKINFNEK